MLFFSVLSQPLRVTHWRAAGSSVSAAANKQKAFTFGCTPLIHAKPKVIRDMTDQNQIRQEDQVIAHFLSKLIQLYTEQEASEKNVREFVRVCNEYLTGKELVYDNIKYTIFIRQFIEQGEQLNMNGDTLALKNLSSGEKQIVSFFSHIYLSGAQSFFVVIDEPELSLSVPWQRRFLPDIVNSGLCGGLIAATHSPFVWENQLEPYVRSLREFTTPHHVLRRGSQAGPSGPHPRSPRVPNKLQSHPSEATCVR